MGSSFSRRGILAVLCICVWGNSAFAGGWDRFDQGVDLLFDRSAVVFDAGLYDLITRRRTSTVNGVPESVNAVPNIFRTSLNAKVSPTEQTSCLVSYRQPFGLANDYGRAWSQAATIVSQTLTVNELGLTCSYRHQFDGGYLRLIGGVTKDVATFHQEAFRTLPNGNPIQPGLDTDATAYGWRAGLAYEVPSKALTAAVMYYSQLDFSAHGFVRQLPLGGNAVLGSVAVHAESSLPQAVEIKVQSAIAPNWFNTAAVKWVEWSRLTSIPVIVSANAGPIQAGTRLNTLNVFFRDGWTISDTITYRWNERLALSLRIGWDRGVSTGWTDNYDSWQTYIFANYKLSDQVEVIGGVGRIFLAAGEINKLAQGGMFNATFGSGSAVLTNVGLRYRF